MIELIMKMEQLREGELVREKEEPRELLYQPQSSHDLTVSRWESASKCLSRATENSRHE
jgi:hypothetical protein